MKLEDAFKIWEDSIRKEERDKAYDKAAKVVEKMGRHITDEWIKDRKKHGENYYFAFWHNDLREIVLALKKDV